jgi:hypothetical protein
VTWATSRVEIFIHGRRALPRAASSRDLEW